MPTSPVTLSRVLDGLSLLDPTRPVDYCGYCGESFHIAEDCPNAPVDSCDEVEGHDATLCPFCDDEMAL